jgi:2'-5' RNA ligase
MNRLFISLKIPDNILQQITSIRKKIYGSGIIRKWESEDKQHLTLKFLGDTDKEDEIKNALQKLLNNKEKIYCKLKTFGLFYRNEIPNILWVSIQQNDQLYKLHESIENSMQKLGFDKEKRSFKPHITILRNKISKDLEILEKFKNYNLGNIEFVGKEVQLMKSTLLPTGSEYKIIEKYELINRR